jgi:hypothetical protein
VGTVVDVDVDVVVDVDAALVQSPPGSWIS